MAQTPKAYTEDTIHTYQNLELVRQRPSAYLYDRGVLGILHAIREILDNSVDELTLNPDGGIIYICLFKDRVKQRYQVAIMDNGRGIPANALEDVTTKLGASGKSTSDTAYVASGGLFGFGFKVSAALSTRFRVITSNYLEDRCASIYLNDANIVSSYTERVEEPSGVLSIVELDLNFFNNSMEFVETGYLDLVAVCRQLNIFTPKINFQFYLYDRKIPDSIWTDPIQVALSTFRSLLQKKQKTIEYSSLDYPDKSAYLLELWRVEQKPIFYDQFIKYPQTAQDRLGFDIKLYFLKKSQTGRPKYFVSINNISLPDTTGNSATIAWMVAFREMIGNHIADPKYKDFVMQDYQFPTMLLALGMWYHNAELSGATKTTFRDDIFADQFYAELMQVFLSKGDEYWNHLCSILQSDIELQFNRVNDVPTKKIDKRKLFLELNFENNYYECRVLDPERSELYIVEGTSASNIRETRDPMYQAVYTTRGKPFNPATSIDKRKENRDALLMDPIYKDILRILGVNPNFTTTPRVQFNKVIIATDADTDGSHIRALHLHDFYIINERFITEGFLWLANPPLYSMNIPRGGKLFLRDRTALMDAQVDFLYRPSLEIATKTIAGITKLEGELYRETCYLIRYLGEHFSLVAKQLNIPLLILERLVLAVDALYPTVNYIKLQSYFQNCDPSGFVRVQLNEQGRFMVVSVGKEDYPIGLDAVGTLIINHLQKLVIKYHYKDIVYILNGKLKGSNVHDLEASPMMVYIALKQLDNLFKVSRYKGLGQLAPEDCASTLMDPATRSLTQVTSLGDSLINYQLLGKDSTERKQLLNTTGMMTRGVKFDIEDI